MVKVERESVEAYATGSEFAQALGASGSFEKMLEPFGSKVDQWFLRTERRQDPYLPSIDSTAFLHSEPWVTFAILQSAFGVDGTKDELICGEFTRLVNQWYPQNPILPIVEIIAVRVEIPQARIQAYDGWLRGGYARDERGIRHPYLDRFKECRRRIVSDDDAMLEGSTIHDAAIHCQLVDGSDLLIAIEAKFLSDAANQVTLAPIRNQLARVLDCVVDLQERASNSCAALEAAEIRFLALTPGMFRPVDLPSPTLPTWRWPNAERSRLFCYKLREYIEGPAGILADLSHRAMEANYLAGRIGWATFEDLIQMIVETNAVLPEDHAAFQEFMEARALWPA